MNPIEEWNFDQGQLFESWEKYFRRVNLSGLSQKFCFVGNPNSLKSWNDWNRFTDGGSLWIMFLNLSKSKLSPIYILKKCWCFRELSHLIMNLCLLSPYVLCFFHWSMTSSNVRDMLFSKSFLPHFEKFFTPLCPKFIIDICQIFENMIWQNPSFLFKYVTRIGFVGWWVKTLWKGVKNFWKVGKKLLIVDVYIMNINCW